MGTSSVVRRRVGAVALAVAAVALVWLLLSGGGDSAVEDGADPPPPATRDAATADEPAADVAATDEELVETVMLVGFEGSDPSVAEELAGRAYGGVLIGPQNWKGKEPGRKLIEAIREADEGDPPLIVAAQEGGPYRTLPDLPPDQREIEIGDVGRTGLAEAWGEETAQALAGVGIDLNLAPIADVATLDSAIADRAFSDDTATAADMTAAAVEGCEKGGISCAVGHFPGLGAAAQSTDAGPASIGLDPATLQSRDLPPFLAAFEAGAPATVVSHGLYTAYDPVTPASLSPAIVTGLLREDLGYTGVAISDDIGAGAISATTDPGSAAVEALNAGIDLVQVADPADVNPVREALAAALASGDLDEDRIREAAARVAELGDQGSDPSGEDSDQGSDPSEEEKSKMPANRAEGSDPSRAKSG